MLEERNVVEARDSRLVKVTRLLTDLFLLEFPGTGVLRFDRSFRWKTNQSRSDSTWSLFNATSIFTSRDDRSKRDGGLIWHYYSVRKFDLASLFSQEDNTNRNSWLTEWPSGVKPKIWGSWPPNSRDWRLWEWLTFYEGLSYRTKPPYWSSGGNVIFSVSIQCQCR